MTFSIGILNLIKNIGSSIYVFFAYFGSLFSEPLVNGNDIPLNIMKQIIYDPFSGLYKTIDFSTGTIDDNFIKIVNELVDFFNISNCDYVFQLFLYVAIPLVLTFFTIGILKVIFKFIF